MAGRGGAIVRLADDVIKPLFKKADDLAEDAARAGRKVDLPGSKTPDVPKKKSLPPEVLANFTRGNKFNEDNYARYPHREVTLDNGKRLDSYRPGDAIVSRKHTQLGEVNEQTAKGYINELENKYSPGTLVKTSEHNGPAISGRPLSGQPTLEVPVQNGPIPASILNHARSQGVDIVDPTGHVYT